MKNKNQLIEASNNLSKYFNNLNWFWRLFFPKQLAQALQNNASPNQILTSFSNSTWFFHKLIFTGLSIFESSKTADNNSGLGDVDEEAPLHIAENESEQLTTPTINSLLKKNDESIKQPVSPALSQNTSEQSLTSEDGSIELITSNDFSTALKNNSHDDSVRQNIKNSFVNYATCLAPSLVNEVKIAIDGISKPNTDSINNSELLRAIEMLANNKIIKAPSSKDGRSWSEYVQTFSVWSLPKTNLTSKIIERLVTSPSPLVLAYLYKRLNAANHLSSDSIYTLDSYSLMEPESLNALLESLCTTCERSSPQLMTADFKNIMGCVSYGELENYIQAIPNLSQDKIEKAIDSIPMHLDELFNSPV